MAEAHLKPSGLTQAGAAFFAAAMRQHNASITTAQPPRLRPRPRSRRAPNRVAARRPRAASRGSPDPDLPPSELEILCPALGVLVLLEAGRHPRVAGVQTGLRGVVALLKSWREQLSPQEHAVLVGTFGPWVDAERERVADDLERWDA